MIEWVTLGLKISRQIPDLARFVGPIIERRRLTAVAVDLASLSFWHNGMRITLEKIVSGSGTRGDLTTLANQLGGVEVLSDIAPALGKHR